MPIYWLTFPGQIYLDDRIYGQAFAQNIAITTHPTLRKLDINGRPYHALGRPGGFGLPPLNGKTELKDLASSGIDLVTWAPILKELTKLEKLRIRYRPWAAPQVHDGELEAHDGEHRHQSEEDVYFHRMAEAFLLNPGVLDEILEPLLGRLLFLSFDLKYPASYRWGAFKRLARLRVPAASFLRPSNWELSATEAAKMPPMIPASLLSLVIMDFAPVRGSHVPDSESDGLLSFRGCGQEFALVCLLEEVGSIDVQKSRDSKPLDVLLVLKDGAAPWDVSPLVKKTASRCNVELRIATLTSTPTPLGDRQELW